MKKPSLLSVELLQGLVALNNKVINRDITHPLHFALALEELAYDAWGETTELGVPTWEDAEDLPPSIRIDP
ncbi:hypothetical protein ACE1AT_13875 [Pelatocladus sp. BLCC-F211]|uniref:hypothetical protein n=1 Tax=Pelatocladus sp. BLCC-F211 TaxID=3342752 RepID=UPI0035B81D25